MTDESMLYQKVDLLNGLFPNLDTEAEKDTCNAILADVLTIYKQFSLELVKGGSVPAATAGVELAKEHEPVPIL